MSSEKTRPKWFGFHVDDFLEDPRILHLSGKEKAQWVLLLIMMFKHQAAIPDDIEAISNLIGITKNEAEKLRGKLVTYRLLHIQLIDGVNCLVSNRLAKEHEKACSLIHKKIAAGIASGEARKKRIQELEQQP